MNIKSFLKRNYQDVVAVGFFVIIHPLLVHSPLLEGSWEKDNSYLAGFLFLLIGLAYPGNFYKLRALEVQIKSPLPEYFTWLRFLAGIIVLPVFTLSLAVRGLQNLSENCVGWLWLGLCIPGAWIFFGYGKEKKKPHNRPVWENKLGTVFLLIAELTLYTAFLEIFPKEQIGFHVSWNSFLFLTLPMSFLYFVFFLPLVVSFVLEEYLKTNSLKKTLLRRWAHFIFFRYVPIYFVYFWNGL